MPDGGGLSEGALDLLSGAMTRQCMGQGVNGGVGEGCVMDAR